MNDLKQINEVLSRNLPVQSVAALDGFPFGSYSAFLEEHKNGRVEILTAFNPAVVPNLGSSSERALYQILTWSPALVAAVLVVLSVAMGDFWLLIGIPLAGLGFLLSTPFFMKSIGSTVAIAAVTFVIYAWFQGYPTAAIIVGAYYAANYLTSVARTQCDMIASEAVQHSELVLIWLYSNRSVILRSRTAQSA